MNKEIRNSLSRKTSTFSSEEVKLFYMMLEKFKDERIFDVYNLEEILKVLKKECEEQFPFNRQPMDMEIYELRFKVKSMKERIKKEVNRNEPLRAEIRSMKLELKEIKTKMESFLESANKVS